MTISQKRQILERIMTLSKDIETLRKTRTEVASSGYASASLSSSGGSKSYTVADLDKLTDTINELLDELAQMRNLLAGGNGRMPPKQVYQVWY